jgi:hypothetical protein
MAEQKTKPTTQSIPEFIDSFVQNEQKKVDSYELIKIIQEITGYSAKMWGPSIIGFGRYHYKYASGHEGDAPVIGFSPRKVALSLYVYSPCAENDELLKDLGKYTMGKACIYVKKLSDINLDVLKQLITTTTKYMQSNYPTYNE